MFDQLFKRASTRARHVTAPFAEERARYLDYCELRGDLPFATIAQSS